MQLSDLLEMDMGDVVDWLIENSHEYVLVKKSDIEEEEDE